MKNKPFIDYIERMVSHGDVTYIDAVVEYCEQNNLDITHIIPQIKKLPTNIIEHIEKEAIDLNYIKSDIQAIPFDD